MIDDILAALARSDRPLVVCDIDEVVLEFLDPFQDYLQSVDHRLHPDSFKLTGNVRRISDGISATREAVDAFQEAFFAAQHLWQRPAPDCAGVLGRLKDFADIVFLTAMPPRHHEARRAVLDTHEFRFPMISTEDAKGPVVARLIGTRGVPAVFIDDIYTNLHSVRSHAPDCLLIHLMANATFRAMAPDPGEGVEKARDWPHADQLIRAHFRLPQAAPAA
jgi:hypothetical protein